MLRPISASAICEIKLVPCGGFYEPQCSLCHVFDLLYNIIEFILICLFPIASVLMLVIGGMYILMVGVSPAQLQKGKEIIKGAVIGILVVFGAWVFINTVLTKIGVAEWMDIDNWWNFYPYGTVSGFVYHDENGNQIIDATEPALPGWQIVLSGDTDRTQFTDSNGYYSFATCLSGGNYTISIVLEPGVVQTIPSGGPYSITLLPGDNLTGKDFAVYIPICGNGIVDTGEQCDDGNNNDDDECTNACRIPWPVCQTDEDDDGIYEKKTTLWGDNLYGCVGTNWDQYYITSLDRYLVPANHNARCVNGECVFCDENIMDNNPSPYIDMPKCFLYIDGCNGCAQQKGLACWCHGQINTSYEYDDCETICLQRGKERWISDCVYGGETQANCEATWSNFGGSIDSHCVQKNWRDSKCWVQCFLYADTYCSTPYSVDICESGGYTNCDDCWNMLSGTSLPGQWFTSNELYLGYSKRWSSPQECTADGRYVSGSGKYIHRVCVCDW